MENSCNLASRDFEFFDLSTIPKPSTQTLMVIKSETINLQAFPTVKLDSEIRHVVQDESASSFGQLKVWRTQLLSALASKDLESKKQLSEELDGWDGWDGWDALTSPNRLELSALLGSLNRQPLWAD